MTYDLCHMATGSASLPFAHGQIKGVTDRQGSYKPTQNKVPNPESGDRGRHWRLGEDNG